MTIRIVRLGSPRAHGEGVRFGTVRRPPRGVPKSEFATRDYYDVWTPALSPSLPLMKAALASKADEDAKAWAKFERAFRAELEHSEGASNLLGVLAALSHTTSFSVGCYCEDEAWCHRSVLRALLVARGARVEP